MSEHIKQRYISFKDAISVHLPVYVFLGVMLSAAIWSLWLPTWFGADDAEALSLSFGTANTVAAVPSDSIMKMVYANQTYFMVFSSTTNDGARHDLFFSSSTNGTTWASSSQIYEGVSNSVGFDFAYSETGNYFGLILGATSTSNSGDWAFASSSAADGLSWSPTTTVNIAEEGYFNSDVHPHIAFATNSEYVALGLYMSGSGYTKVTVATSSDQGVSFTSNTVREFGSSGSLTLGGIDVHEQGGGPPSIHLAYAFGDSDNTIRQDVVYASSSDNGATFTSSTLHEDVDTGGGFSTMTRGSTRLAVDDGGVVGIVYKVYESLVDCPGACTLTGQVVLGRRHPFTGAWTTSTVDNFSGDSGGMNQNDIDMSFSFFSENAPLFAYVPIDGSLYPLLGVNTSTPADPTAAATSSVRSDASQAKDTVVSHVYATTTQKVAVAYVTGGSLVTAVSDLDDPDVTLTRPAIDSSSVTDGAQYVPVDAAIEVGFDVAMDADTANTTNVIVQANTGNTQGGSPTGANKCSAVTLMADYQQNPNRRVTCQSFDANGFGLATSTWYTLTITTDVNSSNGVGMAANATYTFQTGEFVPGQIQTPATVLSTYPSPGKRLPLNSNILIEFSTDMATSSNGSVLSTDNIILKSESNGVQSGANLCASSGCTLSFSSTTRILTIDPATNLNTSTDYALTIQNVQTDQGFSIPGSRRMHFRTDTAANIAAPTVLDMIPASSTSKVAALNLGFVSLKFSKPMDESTLDGNNVTIFQDADENFTEGAGEAFEASDLHFDYDRQDDTLHIGIGPMLAQNKQYCVHLNTNVKDISGSGIAMAATVRCFWTKNEAYTAVGPTVESIEADNFNLAIRFDQPISTSTAMSKDNYRIQSPVGNSIAFADSPFTTLEYNPVHNTVNIGGIGLQPGQVVQVVAVSVADKSGAQTITENNVANLQKAIVQDTNTTGGLVGAHRHGDFGSVDRGAFQENPKRCGPTARVTSVTSTYRCMLPMPTTLTTGGKLIFTMPKGTDVNYTTLIASSSSKLNADANGPWVSTTPYFVNLVTNTLNNTLTLDVAGANLPSGENVHVEFDNIANTNAPGEKAVTMIVKDSSGVRQAQTVSFAPYLLSEGGSRSISGTVCKGASAGGTCNVAGSDSAIANTKVFLESFGSYGSGGIMAGRQKATVDSNGDFTFTGLTNGLYGIGIFMDPDNSNFNGTTGGTMFQDIEVSGSNVSDVDFRFKDISSSGGQTLTATISGGPANEDVDVFCFNPTDHQFNEPLRDKVTLNGSGAGTATITLAQNTIYECGLGPHIPVETMLDGGAPPVPDFTFMPPVKQIVAVAEADVSITFALETTDEQIVGKVTDGSGTAIANVFVGARGSGFDDSGSALSVKESFTKTETDGTFTLKVAKGSYEVMACGAGMPCSASVEVTVRAQDSSADSNTAADVYSKGTLLTGDGLTLKMAKASLSIAGSVKDENGNTISYAGVEAEKVGSSDTCSSFTPQGGHTFSPTDSDGNYTLYLNAGTYKVTAFAASYGEVACEIKTLSSTSLTGVDLQAVSTDYATISGTVTKNSSETSGAFIDCAGASGFNHKVSGTDGTYSMKVKAGTYTCKGYLPGAGPLTASTGEFTVAAEGTQTVNFSIGDPGTITVALGATVTDAFCDARDSSGNGNGTGQADSSGNYTIKVPAGDYTVRCGHPRMGEIGSSSVTITAGGSETVTITPPTLYTITGRVTDGSANLEGSIITFVDKDTNRAIPAISDATSGSSANVSVSIPAGTYEVNASKVGYVDTATAETLTVAADASFTTRALTQASATVSVTVQASSANYTGDAVAVATKSDGRVVVAEVDPAITSGANATLTLTDGTWSVTAYGDNGKSPSSATTVVVTDDTPDNASLTISLDTDITGYTVADKKQQSMTPKTGGLFSDPNIGDDFEVNIPSGALSTSDSSAGTMQTQKAPMYAISTPGKAFIGTAAVEITPKDSNGKAMTSLESPATLTLPYTEADVTTAGVAEEDLTCAVWNESAGDWETLPSTIDTTNNKITCQTEHFSTFGVVGSSGGGSSDSGSSSSSSSSSGGGGAPAFGQKPPKAPENAAGATSKQKITKVFTLKDRVAMTIGASSHHITVNSASASQANVTIESDPITVTVKKDVTREFDTDLDGVNDLRLTYLGLLEGEPQIEFQNLTDEGELDGGFTIEAGRYFTDTRTVELTFNVTGAAQYAISNTNDFGGASFQDFVTSTTWVLSPGDGEKTVYARFRSTEGGTLTLSDTISLTAQGFKQAVDCALDKQKPFKTRTSPAVYYITEQCTKRAFRSSNKYFTYFSSWKDLRIVEDSELNGINNDALGFMPWGPLYDPKYGALVKKVSDPKVYLILDGKRYWIDSEETLEGLGYSLGWIEDIDERLLDKYPDGGEITETATHVDGTLVKYADSAKIYRIDGGKKRHIKDEAAFTRLGYRWDRIVEIPDTEEYDDGESLE